MSLMASTKDNAERGIALIESFSGQFQMDEEHLQFALQVVADHFKKFSKFFKTDFAQHFWITPVGSIVFRSILLMNKKNIGHWTLNSSWRTVLWYWYLK